MTVQTSSNVATGIGNGVTTVFPVGYKFNEESDLVVLRIDDATSAAETLTLNSDYTVQGAGNEAGGSVTMAAPLAVGKTLTITRIVDILQLTDLRNQGKFFAEVHEDSFDKFIMIMQQLFQAVGDSLQLNAARNRWDAKGRRIINVGDPVDAQDAVTKSWLEAYITALLQTSVGPVQTAASVIIVAPNGDVFTLQDLANTTDPAKGAAIVGYSSLLAFSVSQTVRGKLDQLAVTPYTFGAVGDGVANDTLPVKRAIEHGYTFIQGTFACDPIEISGKTVDVTFAPGSKLVFSHQSQDSLTFTTCSGSVTGLEIDDALETETGAFATVSAETCTDLVFYHPRIVGGKDLPFRLLDSDNCHVVDGVGIGSDVARPFAWQLVGCKASTFTRCRLYKYQFGFVILGPGYKSGGADGQTPATTRAWEDTLGMQIIDCYVEDHLRHAFNGNGCVGATMKGCTAKNNTGDGAASFQFKQSTNIPAEEWGDTWANTIDTCTAIDGGVSFGSQGGTHLKMRNITAIRSKIRALSLNYTPDSEIDGLTIVDWGLDADNLAYSGVYRDGRLPAILIESASDRTTVDNVKIYVKTDHAKISVSSIVHLDSARCQLGSVITYKRGAIATLLDSNIRILGGFNNISGNYKIGGTTFYSNPIVIDEANTTRYPVSVTATVQASTSTLSFSDVDTTLGILPVKLVQRSTQNAVNSPTLSIGAYPSSGSIVSGAPIPANNVVSYTDVSDGEAVLPGGLVYATVTIPSGGSARVTFTLKGLVLL